MEHFLDSLLEQRVLLDMYGESIVGVLLGYDDQCYILGSEDAKYLVMREAVRMITNDVEPA